MNFSKVTILLFLMCSYSFGMTIKEINAKLKSGDEDDYIQVSNYFQKVIKRQVEVSRKERLEIAQLLYEFRDEELQEFNREDQFYARSGDSFVRFMARLSFYAETFPEEELNEMVNGSKVDPYNSFAYDPEARRTFLTWFENIHLKITASDNQPRRLSPKQVEQKDLHSLETKKKLKEEGFTEAVISSEEKSPSRLPWIITGVLLVGILALLFKVLKGKSAS